MFLSKSFAGGVNVDNVLDISVCQVSIIIGDLGPIGKHIRMGRLGEAGIWTVGSIG